MRVRFKMYVAALCPFCLGIRVRIDRDDPQFNLKVRQELWRDSVLLRDGGIEKQECCCEPNLLIRAAQKEITRGAAPVIKEEQRIDPNLVIPAMQQIWKEQSASELRRFKNVFVHSPRQGHTYETFRAAFIRVARWDNLRLPNLPEGTTAYQRYTSGRYLPEWGQVYWSCVAAPKYVYKDHMLGWHPIQGEHGAILRWETVKIGLRFTLAPLGHMWKYEAVQNTEPGLVDEFGRKAILWQFTGDIEKEVFDHAQDLVYQLTHTEVKSGPRTG